MKTLKRKSGKAARPSRATGDCALEIKTVLVPVDFSECSQKALKYAAGFARQFRARLILLHVIEPVTAATFPALAALVLEDDQAAAACKAHLSQVAGQAGVKASMLDRMVVRQGRSYVEICDAAGSLKADLVILSTHGHTGLKHAWLGSTAERVVRHAPCPVLVVRPREREFLLA